MEDRTQHLVANEPFYYDGRTLEVGERFSATPQHAMILEGLSKARLDGDAAEVADETEIHDPVDDSSPHDNSREDRNRRRRDRKRVLHTSQEG